MRRVRFFVLVLLGFLIIFGVMFKVGFTSVLRQVLGMGFGWFLIFLGIQAVMMFLWALKWRVVLLDYDISFKRILPVSFMGYFMNSMTPMGMAGGEPVRAYVLGKTEDISVEDSAASVIVDLFLEIFPLLFLILLAIYYVVSFDVGVLAFTLLLASAIAISCFLAFILLLVVNEGLANLIVGKSVGLAARIPVKFLKNHALDAKKRMDEIRFNFRCAMKSAMFNKKILFFGTIISSVIWFLNILRVYLIFQMLGVELSIPVLVVTRITVVAVSFASIIPGAVGLWEGSTTWIFSVFGILPATAMAAALIERFFSYLIANIIGFISASYLGYSNLGGKYFE
ncbi:MAG TPA: flippase-like domain-containing protein [Candidatus Altiarchaeales archaeon]|nr:flippase-like domain-containing protein [Candidatus Altiarchaeales archaeon]